MRYRSLLLKITLSLLSLAVLSCHPLSRLIQEEEVTYWENDIAVFDSLNAAQPAGPQTLLVTGSSSVRLWNTIHEDLAPYEVMQRGYGGAKLTDFNYYAGRIIQEGTMKAILVFVANDIAGGEGDRTPREVFQLYKGLAGKIRERNPGTPLFWIETTPTPSRWHAIDRIRKANGLIRDYCEKHDDLYFIATGDAYLLESGLPDSTLFMNDMLHLNARGYALWTERIKLNLEEAGITP